MAVSTIISALKRGSTYSEAPAQVWAQSLFEESATKVYRLGTIRPLDDGRVFVYSHAGAALAAGELNQAAVPDAYGLRCAVQATAAIGDRHIHITYGAGATATENYYADGFIGMNTPSYGGGHMYKVRRHSAMTSGATVLVELYDEVRVALTASTSKVTLIKHPQDDVIESVITTPTGIITGVNPIAITSAYYFWNQVRGVAALLCNGTWVTGDALCPGGVAGAAMPQAATTGPIVGYCIEVPTDTDYGLAALAIPGY